MNFLTPQINPVSLYRLMKTPPPNGKVRNPAPLMVQQAASLSGSLHSYKGARHPSLALETGHQRNRQASSTGLSRSLHVSGRGQQWTSKQTRKKEHFGCCSGYADKGEWWKWENWAGAGAGGGNRLERPPWGVAAGSSFIFQLGWSPPPANPHSEALKRRGGGWGSGLPRAAPAEAPADPAGRYFRTACPPRPDPGRPRLASRFPVALGSGLVSALRMWRLQIARQLRPGAAGKHASRRHAGQEPPRGAPSAHRGRLAGAEPPAQCAPGLWRSPIAARLHDGQHQGSPVLHEVRGDGRPLCAELTPPLEGLGAWPDPRESFSLLTSSP